MYVISSLNDLERYGFHILTGEADGLGYRPLVDLTPRAVGILSDALGLDPAKQDILEKALCKNMNHSKGAIASALIPYEMWLPLGIHALESTGCHTIFTCIVTRKEHCVNPDMSRNREYEVLYGLKNDEALIREEWEPSETGYARLKEGAKLISGGNPDEAPWPYRSYGNFKRIYKYNQRSRTQLRNTHHFSGRIY